MEIAPENQIEYRTTRDLPRDGVLVLYGACRWSSAEKPDQLMAALAGSHTVISAWHGNRLVGLGNAITDGALVVYYPHLLVHPDFQRRGIGREIMRRLMEQYANYHEHAILADDAAIGFYRNCGFTRPANVRAMWVYSANDHGPPDHWASQLEQQFWTAFRSFDRSSWSQRPLRNNLAIGLIIAQLVMLVVTTLAFFGESESILVTAPTLAVLGYAVAIATWPLLSSRMLAFGLLGPLTTTAGALIVLALSGDIYALVLIVVLLLLYVIVAAITARRVLQEVFQWTTVSIPENRPTRQFSLKSLFIVTTAVAVFCVLAGAIAKLAGTDDDLIAFGVYALANIALCGIVAGRFFYDRQRALSGHASDTE